MSPLLLPMTKGNRKKEELMQETHLQNDNPTVDDVAMAEVKLWNFSEQASSLNFQSQTNYVFGNHKHKIDFGSGNFGITNT